MKVFRRLSAVVILGLMGSSAAGAELIFQGSTTATFGVPPVKPGEWYTINGNVFTTGLAQFGDGNVNRYQIDGNAFSTTPGTPFAVANLSYHNGQTILNSNVTSAPVLFELDFTMPAEIGKQLFDFNFLFTFTSNNPNVPISDPINDDILTTQNVQATSTFTYDNSIYTLRLLGFGPSPSDLMSSFRLPEDQDTQSTLWAVIGAPIIIEPPVVPLPAAAWAGLSMMGALGAWRLRQRRAG